MSAAWAAGSLGYAAGLLTSIIVVAGNGWHKRASGNHSLNDIQSLVADEANVNVATTSKVLRALRTESDWILTLLRYPARHHPQTLGNTGTVALPQLSGTSRHVCCCPFHYEQTGSCKVDLDVQRFKCSGCGALGSVTPVSGGAFTLTREDRE